jgi:hypothetical protein
MIILILLTSVGDVFFGVFMCMLYVAVFCLGMWGVSKLFGLNKPVNNTTVFKPEKEKEEFKPIKKEEEEEC